MDEARPNVAGWRYAWGRWLAGPATDHELRAREARLEALFNNAHDPILVYHLFDDDAPDRFIEVNDAALRQYGYTRDEFLRMTLHDLIDPSVPFMRSLQKLSEETHVLVESVHIARGGHRIPVEVSAQRFVLNGRPTVLSICRDISDRKRTEAALCESESRFRGFAQNMGDVLWIMSAAELRLVYVSPSFERVWGRPADEVYVDIGRLLDYVHPEDRGRIEEGWKRSAGGGSSHEYRVVRPDGSTVWLRDRGFPMRGDDGAAAYIAGIAEDITEQKQAEDELRRLNETLEQRIAERTALAERRAQQLQALASELTQAEQRERRRLAQMLHDHLQQLLVAAKLRIDLAGQRADEALKAPLGQVVELLNHSIEASRSLTLQLSPPILYEGGLLPALDWLARWMAEKHGLRIRVNADTGAEPQSEAVRVLLFEAVRELMFNVAKHANVNCANLEVSRSGDDQVRIVVADAGVGFHPEETPVSQGIGLLSVRERLEFLGGRLDIDSRPGGGTRMTLLAPRSHAPETDYTDKPAPLQPPKPATPAPAAAPRDGQAPGPIRVLLADDHQILRQGLVSLLQEEPDIEIIGEASDGAMAVQMAHDRRPDVVVMDITMPRLSGVEATRRITSDLPGTRVIGLSMHNEADMAAALRDAGAARYLTKGGPSEALVEAIRSVVR